jgi:hypothetical protein
MGVRGRGRDERRDGGGRVRGRERRRGVRAREQARSFCECCLSPLWSVLHPAAKVTLLNLNPLLWTFYGLCITFRMKSKPSAWPTGP